eukprot:1849658-Pleurochrysis_carterae.AAC.1
MELVRRSGKCWMVIRAASGWSQSAHVEAAVMLVKLGLWVNDGGSNGGVGVDVNVDDGNHDNSGDFGMFVLVANDGGHGTR